MRLRQLLIAAFATSSLFSAQEQKEVFPFPPQREKTAPRFSKQPVVEYIQGILLIPNQNYVGYCDTRHLHGLYSYDVEIPGGIECLQEILEPLFMGRALTQELLNCLKREIILYYRNHDHPVVSVYLPEQEVVNGVIQIVVMESCVGQIACSGGKWFPNWMYENFLRLGPGDAITADTLMTDVAWLNRNPFRNVDVMFTPGCNPCTTNIELVICDRCPLQFYVGADNTGTSVSGEGRFFAGATWGNAFWLDQILTYQYTTSADFKEFQSHTFHWTIPLFWRHLLLAYGGYSTVKPDSEDIESTGDYFQASLRYVVPMGVNYDGRLEEWTIGFDFKNYNSNSLFVGEGDFVVADGTVNVSQFMVGYAYGCESNWQRFSFNLNLYGSPGKLLPNESNAQYDQLSPRAKNKYIYGLLTVGDVLYLPWCWSFSALGRLQLSSENLLPSERFGIGGYDTVRGYKEREFLADDALILNAELRTPSFSLLNFFGGCNCTDEMLFLAFFDYGLGALNNRNVGMQNIAFIGPKPGVTEWFMSVGPGWRYTINCYLSARVDWGVKLHRSIFSDRSRSRWHAGFVFSY